MDRKQKLQCRTGEHNFHQFVATLFVYTVVAMIFEQKWMAGGWVGEGNCRSGDHCLYVFSSW
ncbi:Uncharacterized protein TCM_038309 [Theobroma cacao]|uniref:Uncharacterized protein n=1 Tax=Theobroma cacao TaxID=3641 RepID=A0A061GPN4_THECC|nr:Uncharacterized protein TCM_038309 [Theobroma cacao]